MPMRIAAVLSLVAFAMSIVLGVVQARNGFSDVLANALSALVGMFVVGYAVGFALKRMLDENLRKIEEESRGSTQEKVEPGR